MHLFWKKGAQKTSPRIEKRTDGLGFEMMKLEKDQICHFIEGKKPQNFPKDRKRTDGLGFEMMKLEKDPICHFIEGEKPQNFPKERKKDRRFRF